MNFFSNLVDYCRNLQEANESQKSIKYVIGEDGIYEIRSNELGTFTVKTNKVIGADSIKEGIVLNIPKIPFVFFQQIYSFFKDINDESQDEVMLQIFLNKSTNEYFIHCPVQEISGERITFQRDQSLYENENYLLVLDIHSHNTMAAFFSGTDDSSEKETRIYGVLGRLNYYTPEFKFRVSIGGKFRTIDMYDVFERDTSCNLESTNCKIGKVEYPIEWRSKLTKVKSKFTKNYNYTNYSKRSNTDFGNNKHSGFNYDWTPKSEKKKDYNTSRFTSLNNYDNDGYYDQFELDDYNSSYLGYSKSSSNYSYLKAPKNYLKYEGSLNLPQLYERFGKSNVYIGIDAYYVKATEEELALAEDSTLPFNYNPEKEKIKKEIASYDPEKDEYFGLSFEERISKMKEKKNKQNNSNEFKAVSSTYTTAKCTGNCEDFLKGKTYGLTVYIKNLIDSNYGNALYCKYVNDIEEPYYSNIKLTSIEELKKVNIALNNTYQFLLDKKDDVYYIEEFLICLFFNYYEFLYCYMKAYDDEFIDFSDYKKLILKYREKEVCRFENEIYGIYTDITKLTDKNSIIIYFIYLFGHFISMEYEEYAKNVFDYFLDYKKQNERGNYFE